MKFFDRFSDSASRRSRADHAYAVDVRGITETIQRALKAAGLDTGSGPLKGVTDTIHNALSAAGLNRASTAPHGTTIDGFVREIEGGDESCDENAILPAGPEQHRTMGWMENAT